MCENADEAGSYSWILFYRAVDVPSRSNEIKYIYHIAIVTVTIFFFKFHWSTFPWNVFFIPHILSNKCLPSAWTEANAELKSVHKSQMV